MARLHWIRRLGRWLLVVGAIAAAPICQARADDQYSAQYGTGQQSAAVARISASSGSVVIQHADSSGSLEAVVNAPVAVGDYVSTGANSHAEVQLDDTNFLRVGSHTQIRFTALDNSSRTVQLAAGTVQLSVLRHPDSHPEIQTPNSIVRPYESGRYRVTVTESGNTIVTVRSGHADLVGPQQTQTVGAGISMLVTGTWSAPHLQTVATVDYDDFDSWNVARDQAAVAQLSTESYAADSMVANSYGNSGIVGLASLNQYGTWYNQAAYGCVWVPYGQIAGWSPYRFGRWAWQPYYGWTWIGYEPWGWAPYHYGRWFYTPGFGWAWFPGPPNVYFWWQPALVVFFGFGTGYPGYGSPFWNIGWAPLGPYEPFIPFQARGPVISRSVPVTTITNIGSVYRNTRA